MILPPPADCPFVFTFGVGAATDVGVAAPAVCHSSRAVPKRIPAVRRVGPNVRLGYGAECRTHYVLSVQLAGHVHTHHHCCTTMPKPKAIMFAITPGYIIPCFASTLMEALVFLTVGLHP